MPATDRQYEFSMGGERINATRSRGPCRVLAKWLSMAERWDFGTAKMQASRGRSVNKLSTYDGLLVFSPQVIMAC